MLQTSMKTDFCVYDNFASILLSENVLVISFDCHQCGNKFLWKSASVHLFLQNAQNVCIKLMVV